MKKILLSLVLVVTLMFPLPAFAGATDTESEAVIGTHSASTEADSAADKGTDVSAAGAEATSVTDNHTDSGKWTSEDFTYTDISKTIYGCDYTRTINVEGKAISGFSAKGEAKFKKNKNLVLPSKDDKGNTIVGVASNAFQKKGVESVVFPSGMLTSYNDTVTHKITRRGNFVIAEGAFEGNKLTNVTLPDGVLAVLPNAFMNNKIKTVTLPRTIWWLETQAFANNQISKVNFPLTTYFQLEMHGMTFANNKIKSIRLPDFTAVVNKHVFVGNPGMEPLSAEGKAALKGNFAGSGVVYMYSGNFDHKNMDRIHTTDKTTASTKSWVQKLINYDGTPETENKDTESWNVNDFTFDGQKITGLSASGKEKRKVNKDLVLPDYNASLDKITEIADTDSTTGLFATADEKFDSVTLPMDLEKVGKNAFRDSGLKEVAFSPVLKSIGDTAFQSNNIKTVVLPDTLTSLGKGAFATNPTIEKINLPNNLAEIPDSAFGCSDKKNWMTGLTSIEIPASVKKIGTRAFAGNNFTNIKVPKGVTEIGDYAFSTKNYLLKEAQICNLELPEGLTTIGKYAFRNKKVAELKLPATVTALPKNVFAKEVTSASGKTEKYDLVTKVYVDDISKYSDTSKFPKSEFHKILSDDVNVWNAEDFTYADVVLDSNNSPAPAQDNMNIITGTIHVVSGLTDSGKAKLASNKNLVVPAVDDNGNKVQGVGSNAFKSLGLESVDLPKNVKAPSNGQWDSNVTTRGDFFIGSSAFQGNNLTELTVPEGTIYIGGNAFNKNKLKLVKFPSTLMLISNGAFANNEITNLEFHKTTDYPLSIDNMAFAMNKIESVQLPDKTEKVTKWTFLRNTGKEPVTTGNANEKKGGIVYMYINEPGALVDDISNGKSHVQLLKANQNIPSDESPWNSDDFTYNAAGTVVTGLTESGKAKLKKNDTLVIPETNASGVKVVAIGNGVSNVLASNGQIGTFGFADAGKIYVPKTVKLPPTIKQIGDFAFAGTIDNTAKKVYGVVNVNLPDGLESIGNSAFLNARLTSIVLPNSVKKLGIGAFNGTDLAEKIVISKSLKEIPDVAFGRTNDTIGLADKAAVTDIVIPEGVTDIGRRAFVGCKAKTVSLPDSLTKIGDNAFMNNQLTEVTIPSGITSIGRSAFEKTAEAIPSTLKSLKFKEGFNGKIGSNAFLNQLLTSVELPKSFTKLTGVDKRAFRGNPVKPTLLTENKEVVDAYNNMPNKAELTYVVKYDNLVGTGWTSEDFTYSADGSTITGLSSSGITKRNGGNHKLVLPNESPAGVDITAIADGAFAIPESEVKVGKYDFTSENGFESVKLPAKLKSIGSRAFEYNMLKELDLESEPELTKIGTSAFHGNRIMRLHIPDSVNDLGEGAFSANSIIELKMSKNVTKIPQAAFSMNIRLREIEIPDTVTEIGQMAFAGARLESLKIPASVRKIGEKAFHLHHLTELTIPGTVKEIGDSAFEGTYKSLTLTSLKIEEGVEHIGKFAFKEGLLTSVDLPKSLKTLGNEPFMNNTGTDANHVVILRTVNPDHLAFNTGATTHRVMMSKAMITFDANGGTVEKGYAVLDDNGRVDSLPTPTAPDALHEFEGWFTEREGGKKVTASQKFNDGTKLYAHWKQNTTWNEKDFTTDGDTITGLSEVGKVKLAVNPDLKLPVAVNGTAIKKIGTGAFAPAKTGGNPINSVTIPEGVTEIGQAAFYGANLKSLELPKSVKIIGKMAFSGAPLENVKFSEGLESIGDNAFEGHKLVKVKLPDSLKTIGKSAFKSRSPERASIKEVEFGKSLQSIGREAFANQNIKEIKVPETLRDVPANAFKGNVVDGKDAKVKLISSNEDQRKGTGAYSNFKVKDPAATFYVPYKVELLSNDEDAKTTELTTDENGKITLNALPDKDVCTAFEGWFTAKTGGVKVDGTQAFTEDTKLYAHWLVSHDLEEIAANAPTTEADGNIKYWHCKKCDKYYLGSDAKHEIKKSETVIPKITYNFEIGDNALWTKGDGDLLFVVKRSVDDANTFDNYYDDKILLDGIELVKDVDYTSEKGSVRITLKKAVLDRQSTGSHTLTVAFKDKRGGASTNFTIRTKNQPIVNGNTSSSNGNRDASAKYHGYRVSRAVKTGDTTVIALYLAMMAIAAGALAVFAKKRKSEK
ncbi:leucine-rich repeat protein [Mogibacterium pumilum]|uniref:Gram-positive cocci surface proteins LPxTG domain-containing protein n=1 Tax=Mogibacterium pumilum TaxID=86332 RepID=A0A223AQL0_9FIRM|nr:leucine-rich repeat protein [Mogibacterium pumilum]ASS37232.1 hypothetical protein AXF17_01255 [Mogibacterium pumilum]